MAELTSGAVSTLLGVISNEAQLLGGVEGDVQFIKGEMESMNSFLLHLARTEPPNEEHDEQVRAWMSQVRLLAQDCNNCIDLYLYRGNPDIHLAEGGLKRCLQWAPWFLRKMRAQHRAATQLRELKERTREVGERRMRYGVEVPAKASATSGPSSSTGAAATSTHVAYEGARDEEQDGGHRPVVDTVIGHFGRWPFEPWSWEDSFEWRLLDWMEDTAGVPKSIRPRSIAIVASNTHQQDEACTVARKAIDAMQVHHILVDIPAVHDDDLPLRPKEILYYILWELMLEHARTQSQARQQEATSSSHQDEEDEKRHQSSEPTSSYRAARQRKDGIYSEQIKLFGDINDNIQLMKVDDKLEKVKSEILQVGDAQLQPYLGQIKDSHLEPKISKEPLGLLLLLLKLAAVEQDQVGKKKAKRTVAAFYKDLIKATGSKLKKHIEAGHTEAGTEQPPPICLSGTQYEQILQEMFPKTNDSNAQEQDKKITTTTPHEDKQEILRVVFQIPMTGNSKAPQDQDQQQENSTAKHAIMTTLGEDPAEDVSHVDEQDALQGVNEDKRHTKQVIPKQDGHGKIPDSMVQEPTEKMDTIKKRIKAQMKIKGIVDKIKEHLKYETVIILKVDETMGGSLWEETRKALRLLDNMSGALIITTTRSALLPKEYFCPQGEPIDCSVVGLYHTTVLKLTNWNEQQGNNTSQLFRDILDYCELHECCMKIFAHALYSKPMRRYGELENLCSTLKAVSPKSFTTIAQKMIKFSYNDLTKEYKSCLLYLAIFPQGHIIRRSDLIGRWVVEGLITTEDWSWPSSVDKAEQCFETLINRWLVYPTDIGVTGAVKSCMVGDLVYEFITTIAKKQRTLRLRLSHHLAHHFSISNNLRLRGSDTIHSFLEKLPELSQFSLLKVLDLENCQCFGVKNKRYLKDICCKILLLKYLSLRGTNVTHLPKQINKLHQLEVLDIRHTRVPVDATRNVRLLKLKRLLAGHIDPSPSNTYREEECPSSVQVPDKIGKMLDMEVLSDVKAPSNQALENIGALCQLRKLGVVIEEKDSRLKNLLVAIGNMHECLRSLSITIQPIKEREGTPSSRWTPSSANNDYGLSYPPKLLESLSISGITQKVHLLGLLSGDGNSDKLAKVTLSRTSLIQENMKVLGKLPRLQCVRFQNVECIESILTFKKGELNNLKYLLVEGSSNLTRIIFEKGAACKLEKMLLSFTNIGHISGVDELLKLEEIELNHNCCGRLLSSFDNARQIAKLTLRGTSLEQADLQILGKKPNIRSLLLLEGSSDVCLSQITFNKHEFPKLSLLIVDFSTIAKIIFTSGSVPKLEKIILSSFTSLSDINNIPRLKELEFKGLHVPDELKEAIKKHRNNPTLKHIEP